jgi:L-lactate utilization protein LutC
MQVGFALSDSGGIILKSGAPLKRAVSLTTTLHGEFKPKN